MAEDGQSATCQSISDTDMLLDEVDECLDNYDGEKAYEALDKVESQVPEALQAEFLWRRASACYILHNTDSNEKRRLKTLREGHKAALGAYKLAPTHLEVLKQCAVLSGTLAENSGIKEKATLGFEFKKFLDAALEVEPDDFALLHMRGRFLYQVSGLSWIEKTAAKVVFGKIPQANYELALNDLLKAEQYAAHAIDNLLYIGKCYKAKGDKTKARQYLQKVISQEAIDAVDREQIDEAVELMGDLKI